MSSKKTIFVALTLVPLTVANTLAFEPENFWTSLEGGYVAFAAGRICGLFSKLDPGLLEYATNRTKELERKSPLSQAEKEKLIDVAIDEASTLVGAMGCKNIDFAFQMLNFERAANLSNPSGEPTFERPSQKSEIMTGGDTSSSELPILAGPYVRKPDQCADLERRELDIIDFNVEDNRRTFSTGSNTCVVASIQEIRKSRFKIEADCTEVDELSKLSMILDTVSDKNIRIDGEDHYLCVPANRNAPAVEVPNSKLIEEWSRLNEACRGGSGDDPATLKLCEKRSVVSARLETLGYCYSGDTTAASIWGKCN